MNFRINLFLCLGILCGLFSPKVSAQEAILSEKYSNQSSLTCEGHKVKIPSYFPGLIKSESYYITALQKCSTDYLSINIGVLNNCNGSKVCFRSGFSIRKGEEALDYLFEILSTADGLKYVEINKSIDAYFLPGKCGLYCNPARIIWFKDDKLFVIASSKFHDSESNMNDLIKAVNSYYKQREN